MLGEDWGKHRRDGYKRQQIFAKQMRFIIACLKNVCLENKFKTGDIFSATGDIFRAAYSSDGLPCFVDPKCRALRGYQASRAWLVGREKCRD